MKKILQRALRLILSALLNFVYGVALCWPRRRNVWIFGAWNGRQFNDNPKQIFLYVQEHMPEVESIWITKNLKLACRLEQEGLNAHYYLSMSGMLAQLRAGVAVFTHAIEWEFFAPLLNKRVLRVQTWHGIPIKQIGYDDNNGTSRDRAKLISMLFPYRSDHCDLVLAAGEWDQKHYRSAFNVKYENVVITGYARNDVLIKSANGLMKKEDDPVNVIYMPTLRGEAYSDFNVFTKTEFDFQKADKLLREMNAVMHVRLHPVQNFTCKDKEDLSKCSNIKIVESKPGEDFYESIGQFDALITDYSGIYFDYLLTNKPIIMAPLDLNAYLNSDRGLLCDYQELCPDIACKTWDEVFDQVCRIGKNRVWKPDGRYIELREKFHSYCDADSTMRGIMVIKSISIAPSNLLQRI